MVVTKPDDSDMDKEELINQDVPKDQPTRMSQYLLCIYLSQQTHSQCSAIILI